ncbi:hypothetical protein ACQP1G_34350 [Nocardia sp. CA-107356]|uniref:hypothetical protein n=1 Tax=Nocardia sp. CA-107356 TaxID=3239972 RepID=UPI003D940002
MVVRYTAGAQAAVRITRDELALKWRRPEVWLIAAGVSAVIMAYRFVRYLISQAGSPGRYYTWTSGFAVVVTAIAIYAGVLVILVVLSLLEVRRGSPRVRRYANPGAVLQIRYLSDGLELTTAVESVTYPYSQIKRIRIQEHTVALSGEIGLRVLPCELFPADALSFLERSAAVRPR